MSTENKKVKIQLTEYFAPLKNHGWNVVSPIPVITSIWIYV